MKSDLIDRRISELEQDLARLRMKKVALLQEELNQLQADLNGVRVSKPTKGWAAELAAGGPSSLDIVSVKTGRGKHLSEEDVVERLRKVVAASGSEGISARSAAQEAGVFYLRALKVMAESFVKHGSGKWTRYTIN